MTIWRELMNRLLSVHWRFHFFLTISSFFLQFKLAISLEWFRSGKECRKNQQWIIMWLGKQWRQQQNKKKKKRKSRLCGVVFAVILLILQFRLHKIPWTFILSNRVTTTSNDITFCIYFFLFFCSQVSINYAHAMSQVHWWIDLHRNWSFYFFCFIPFVFNVV